MSYQLFLGQFTIGALDFTIGSTACQIAAGNYFMYGYTGESTDQFLEAIQAEIRAETSHTGATVAFNTSTERVTITLDSTDSITFDDTSMADILGFTSGSYSGASSYTAEQNPRYSWLPELANADKPHYMSAANFWVPSSQSIVQRSENGTTYPLAGERIYEASITYKYLSTSNVLTPTTGSVYSDFQQFWNDVIHEAQPFRLVFDKTTYAASSDYITGIVGAPDSKEIGSFQAFRERSIKPMMNMFNVNLTMFKYVQ